jgi:teichuronic acid biosynthesis glycosyltransferase TuaC
MTLPTQRNPQQGTFVASRLSALNKFSVVRVLRPHPWFPIVRSPYLDSSPRRAFCIDVRRMFYIPGVFKAWDGWFMQRCVSAWLKELPVDVEHSLLDAHFGYPEGVGCYLAARRIGLPCFITLRGVEVDWFRIPKVRCQMLEALCNVNGVIAVSQSLKDEAVAQGVPSSQITVIENGYDESVFFPDNQLATRKKLSISPSSKLLVCVANLKPVKGHAVLFKALAKLAADIEWELHCIGTSESGGALIHLEKLRNELGLKNRIVFVGEQPAEQIADYLRASDLFVLASHREGCCNAIIEAMACNCRIVCTDVGDNARLLREYQRCQLVPANDSDALSASISNSMEAKDGALASGLTTIGSWENVAQRTIQFFQERTNNRLEGYSE